MSAKERFQIKSFTNPSGQRVWRVSGRMPDGRQVRKNFKSFEEAIGKKGELEIEALNQPMAVTLKRTRLSDSQLADAEVAFQKLDEKSVIAAVEFYLEHYREPIIKQTVEQACDEFIAAKATRKRRERTIADYESRLGQLKILHAEKQVAEITPAQCERLIFKPGQSALTANGNRRVLHTFFKWCKKKKYVLVNPVTEIEPAEVDEHDSAVLSLNEVRLLLNSAHIYKDGKLAPYVTLALFAGMRPKELARITWSHIDLDQKLVRLGSEVAKLRQRRVIELSENAVAWLAPHVNKPIVPKNWRRDFDTIRRMSGFKGSVRRKRGDEHLKDWPQDLLRHTSLSNHFAHYKDEGKTAAWAGNSPSTLHRFYKGLVSPEQAKTYWALTPDTLDLGKVIRLSRAA